MNRRERRRRKRKETPVSLHPQQVVVKITPLDWLTNWLQLTQLRDRVHRLS